LAGSERGADRGETDRQTRYALGLFQNGRIGNQQEFIGLEGMYTGIGSRFSSYSLSTKQAHSSFERFLYRVISVLIIETLAHV
jgi:hypothetical protein